LARRLGLGQSAENQDYVGIQQTIPDIYVYMEEAESRGLSVNVAVKKYPSMQRGTYKGETARGAKRTRQGGITPATRKRQGRARKRRR